MNTTYFDLEDFLLSDVNFDVFDEKNYRVIDRLCKKIDVVKTLFKFYSNDLSAKKSSDEISSSLYFKMFSILHAEHYLNYKFLNTAFKLNDIFLIKNFIDNKQHSVNVDILSTKLVFLNNMSTT